MAGERPHFTSLIEREKSGDQPRIVFETIYEQGTEIPQQVGFAFEDGTVIQIPLSAAKKWGLVGDEVKPETISSHEAIRRKNG